MFLFILFFVIFILILVLDDSDVDEEVEESSLIANKEPTIKVDENVICSTFYINKKSFTLYKVGKLSDTDGDHKHTIYTTHYCVYENINSIDFTPIDVVSDPDDEYDCYNTWREHKTKKDFKPYTTVKIWDDSRNEDDDLYLLKPNRRVRTHYQARRNTRKDYKRTYISKRDVAEMLWED